jgi:hypothetical protein
VCIIPNGVASAADHTAPRAMALQGGGFRALSSDTGIIAGLLSFLGKQQGMSKPTMNGTGLLDDVGVLSTVSGSSWFTAELVYSPQFRTLMEGIAANPHNGSALFAQLWFDPFKRATGVSPSAFDPLRDIAIDVVTKLFGKADEDTLFTFQYVLSTNATWNEFVQILLSSTGSIDLGMTLSAPVDKWANQKLWLCDHTLLLPSEKHKALLYKGVGLRSFQEVTYVAQSSQDTPTQLPAKFSMMLGGQSNGSAPAPYIAAGALAGSNSSFEYEGVIIPFFDTPTDNSGKLGSDLAGGALMHKTGELPIWGVAAASSAAFGYSAVLKREDADVLSALKADLTPWVSRATDGASFSHALELVEKLAKPSELNKQNVEALASSAVHAVVDGGQVDSTGLGLAIAQGASEVVVLLNSAGSIDGYPLELLCKDGPKPAYAGQPAELYPLFETPASEVQTALSGLHKMYLPPETQFLKTLLVGSIQVKTAENKYFGISSGKTVTVNVIYTASDLTIGEFEKYVNYGTFVQEISLAIVAEQNGAFVKGTLLPMFIGSQHHRHADALMI